jgi:hypothetical protein
MENIFTEEQMGEFAKQAVAKFMPEMKKMMDNASCEFENAITDNAWQMYNNHKEKIDRELIAEITERFKKEPENHRFNDLREKLFEENKESIIPVLTQDAVSRALDIVLNRYTHQHYYFSWRWKEEILRFVLENWDKLKDDARINQGILSDKQKDKEEIAYWKEEAMKYKSLAGTEDLSE